MSKENVELARAALNAFAELDEGLVDPQRVEEFFEQDVITTFSGFQGFMAKQGALRGPLRSTDDQARGSAQELHKQFWWARSGAPDRA